MLPRHSQHIWSQTGQISGAWFSLWSGGFRVGQTLVTLQLLYVSEICFCKMCFLLFLLCHQQGNFPVFWISVTLTISLSNLFSVIENSNIDGLTFSCVSSHSHFTSLFFPLLVDPLSEYNPWYSVTCFFNLSPASLVDFGIIIFVVITGKGRQMS